MIRRQQLCVECAPKRVTPTQDTYWTVAAAYMARLLDTRLLHVLLLDLHDQHHELLHRSPHDMQGSSFSEEAWELKLPRVGSHRGRDVLVEPLKRLRPYN